MIVSDKHKRVILWGYASNATHVLGQLAFLSDNMFNPCVELENGVVIRIPDEYLSQNYPTALAYFKAEKLAD
jgi:hypothetical protein